MSPSSYTGDPYLINQQYDWLSNVRPAIIFSTALSASRDSSVLQQVTWSFSQWRKGSPNPRLYRLVPPKHPNRCLSRSLCPRRGVSSVPRTIYIPTSWILRSTSWTPSLVPSWTPRPLAGNSIKSAKGQTSNRIQSPSSN
mgnify:CR=1 FL=1